MPILGSDLDIPSTSAVAGERSSDLPAALDRRFEGIVAYCDTSKLVRELAKSLQALTGAGMLVRVIAPLQAEEIDSSPRFACSWIHRPDDRR